MYFGALRQRDLGGDVGTAAESVETQPATGW
ncbi:Uncharacterised protein [Mycobacterium tuberculosis]|nr:Uncharacterised protein [Mycobacterium tuberculosis]